MHRQVPRLALQIPTWSGSMLNKRITEEDSLSLPNRRSTYMSHGGSALPIKADSGEHLRDSCLFCSSILYFGVFQLRSIQHEARSATDHGYVYARAGRSVRRVRSVRRRVAACHSSAVVSAMCGESFRIQTSAPDLGDANLAGMASPTAAQLPRQPHSAVTVLFHGLGMSLHQCAVKPEHHTMRESRMFPDGGA